MCVCVGGGLNEREWAERCACVIAYVRVWVRGWVGSVNIVFDLEDKMLPKRYELIIDIFVIFLLLFAIQAQSYDARVLTFT